MSFSDFILSKLEEPSTLMKIAASEKIGSHIQKVTLSFNPQTKLKFTIGCHIMPEIRAGVTRTYSIVETTESTCTILVSFSGMGMGARFFASSPVGKVLKVYGPYSDFLYHYGTKRPNIFMATGTGIAPFVRMIPEAIKEGVEVFLALGVPREEDIPYRSYFDKLAEKYSNFRTVYVLSKPNTSWDGAQGYITSQFSEKGELLKKCDIYVCGIPPMIWKVLKMLRMMGVSKNQIFIQKFG
jgi:NAD(P)H-flavin reductase